VEKYFVNFIRIDSTNWNTGIVVTRTTMEEISLTIADVPSSMLISDNPSKIFYTESMKADIYRTHE
jgi:hypothetical protein